MSLGAKSKLMLALLVGLGLLAACDRPEAVSAGKMQVAMTLDNPVPHQARVKGLVAKSTLPTDAKTVLILAMPANTAFSGDYTKFRDKAYDAALLNLNSKEVILQLPLDTPLTLFEYSFYEELSLDQLKTRSYSPVAGTDFPQFRVQQKTDRLNLQAYLKLITPPKDLTLVALSKTLAKGRRQQLIAYGNYPGEVRQDVSGVAEWSSSDPSIATIADDPENKGLLEAVSLGSVTITAKAGRATVEQVIMVTPGGDDLGTDFVELMTYGGFELRAEIGERLTWRLTETRYQPFEDLRYYFDPASRSWAFDSASSSAGGRGWVWQGSGWGADAAVDFSLESIDFANAVVKLNSPVGSVFRALNSARLNGQTLNLAQDNRLNVPLTFQDPASRLLTLEYSRPLAQPLVMLWFAESSRSGSYATYPDFASFLAAKASSNDPLTCTDRAPFKCLKLESYSSGQTSGNILETQYDGSFNALTGPQLNGTWRITGEYGPNLLVVTPPGYQDHGYQPAWGLHAGMVWRGGFITGFERQEFQQFNANAVAEIDEFFATAPLPMLYPAPPRSAGGYGGGTVSSGGSGAPGPGTGPGPGPGPSLQPVFPSKALSMMATQSIGNSLAQDFGLANSWSLASTFLFQSTGPMTLFHLKEATCCLNAMLVQITATYAVRVTVYDNTGAVAKDYTTTTLLNLGKTNHLALTWDGTNLRIYLNGLEELSPTLTTNNTLTQTASSRYLVLGADMAGGTKWYGQIHSLAMWDRALGANEVKDLIANAKGEQWDLRMSVDAYSSLGLLHQYHFEMDPASLGTDHVAVGGIDLDAITGSLSLADLPHYPRAGYRQRALFNPYGGEVWIDGGTGNISWNPSEFQGEVDISITPSAAFNLEKLSDFFGLSSQSWTPLVSLAANSGNYNLNPAPFALASCNCRVLIKDYYGHWDISDHNFCANAGVTIYSPATLTADGSMSDWLALSPAPAAAAQDGIGDDQPGYIGDDLNQLWLAQGVSNLYLALTTQEAISTSFQNGPAGSEGVYVVSLSTNAGYYEFGVAYDPVNAVWGIGVNGAQSFGSLALTGVVGQSANLLEIAVPLSELGNPTAVYGVQARFINCCVAGWHPTDEIFYP